MDICVAVARRRPTVCQYNGVQDSFKPFCILFHQALLVCNIRHQENIPRPVLPRDWLQHIDLGWDPWARAGDKRLARHHVEVKIHMVAVCVFQVVVDPLTNRTLPTIVITALQDCAHRDILASAIFVLLGTANRNGELLLIQRAGVGTSQLNGHDPAVVNLSRSAAIGPSITIQRSKSPMRLSSMENSAFAWPEKSRNSTGFSKRWL